MAEIKPFRTIDEQIEILERDKKLVIENKEIAREFLSHVNYYRFINAYGLEFYDKITNTYIKGATFNILYEIYMCDKAIRNSLFTKIETIEIKLRTAVAYVLGKIGALSYKDSNIYVDNFAMTKFTETIDKEVENQSKTSFIYHYKTKYNGIPVWVIVETLSFGTLSIMYRNLKSQLKKDILNMVIAKKAKPGDYYFSKWIHQISILRNTCAHYGRLYDKSFESLDILPFNNKYKSTINTCKLFNLIIPIMKILSDEDCRELNEDIIKIKSAFKNVNFEKYGFIGEWNEILMLNLDNKLF